MNGGIKFHRTDAILLKYPNGANRLVELTVFALIRTDRLSDNPSLIYWFLLHVVSVNPYI